MNEYFSTTMKPELLEWLRSNKKKTGIPVSKQIEQAVEAYKSQQEGV